MMFVDRNGKQVDEKDALDAHGVLRDGFRTPASHSWTARPLACLSQISPAVLLVCTDQAIAFLRGH